MNSQAATYIARIHQSLEKLRVKPPPDTGNAASLMAEFYLWNAVAKYADGLRDQALDAIKQNFPVDGLPPGQHTLCESQHFVTEATVTEPVRQFDAQALAQTLHNSKYRVPLAYTTEAVQKAKTPTKSRVTIRVTER